MTSVRQPPGRRLITAIFGIDRRPTRLELTLGRRILASVLGMNVRPPIRNRVTAPAAPGAEAEEAAAAPEQVRGSSPRPRTSPSTGGPARPPLPPPAEAPRGGPRTTHLLTEDRPDFERLLDTALHSAEYTVGAGRGRTLNPEQLRTMALGAMAAISACAAAEYDRYVRLRTKLRRPTTGDLGSSSAGLAAAAAVLVPVLAGTAAVILLLVGYLLHLMSPEPSVAPSLRQAGWILALLAVAAIVIAAVALLITAVRNGGTPIRAAASRELTDQVDEAREEWRAALLERGIQPFLEEALAGGGTYPAVRTDPTVSRVPRLGYSRPAYSSPDDSLAAADGPGYSSPDFTSPDYGGPEHDPEE